MLTVLGIAIGMTAVVGLWGLTGGVQRALEGQFQRIGHDLVFILPGSTRGLSSSEVMQIDVERLRSMPGAAQVGALLRQALPVSAGKTQGFLIILGLSPETMRWADRFFPHFELTDGRLPLAEGGEVLLTQRAALDLNLSVGGTIQLADHDFRVSGVLRSTGDSSIEGAIIAPLAALWELTGRSHSTSLVWVQAQPGYDVETLAASLEEALRSIPGGFSVQTSKRLNEIIQAVLGVLRAALTGIAAVALLVGGIGLMNTMYMAVLERTREVGILISLGAHSRQIVTLFLFEAALLGLGGGIVGVLLGTGLAISLCALIIQATGAPMFSPTVDLSLVGFSLLFAMGLGMLAGALPARRAALLHPVDALRYE
ncbi:MAG: hypothetical protein A2Z21_01510 [Candidatus Fraserbacteria bacterium RBG_16_55_9]|uniref:ABC transporter permease n=1 Tax=Fraserbacteria sp. (strain RBG_16_55_9) TaxID=1817864 RepID=A0A1F5UX34_FRAXR|nr:MAG: hypothetical protein A2Z21_01510 [Candidatus Fraserbacteria bacterium RBG_16_55_9]